MVQRLKEVVSEVQEQGGRVRLAVFDTVVSMPGVRVPFEALIKVCRELGVLSCVDGAHGVGHVELNLGTLDPDFFVSNCHKYGLLLLLQSSPLMTLSFTMDAGALIRVVIDGSTCPVAVPSSTCPSGTNISSAARYPPLTASSPQKCKSPRRFQNQHRPMQTTRHGPPTLSLWAPLTIRRTCVSPMPSNGVKVSVEKPRLENTA